MAAARRQRDWTKSSFYVSGDGKSGSDARAVVPASRSFAQLELQCQLNDIKRARMLPHLWTVGTAVTGLAGWGMSALASLGFGAVGGAVVPLVVGAASAATHGLIGIAKREELGAWTGRYTLAAGASTSWAVLAASLGVDPIMMSALVMGEAALAARYWRSLRLRQTELLAEPVRALAARRAAELEAGTAGSLRAQDGGEEVFDAEFVEVDHELDEYLLRWAGNVGNQNGPLAGSKLTALERTPIGVQGIVQLKAGQQTLAKALGQIPHIRSGLQLTLDDPDGEPGQELLFDQPVRVGDQRLNASQIRLQIVDKSPVRHSPWFERPTLDAVNPGECAIGLYADGQGLAWWTLFDGDGVWSGVIIAGTGSGKSSLIDVLAISARATGCLNVMYIDPQGGASSPILKENASILALGEDQALVALEALEEIAVNRETYLNAHGLSKIVPGQRVECRVEDCPCNGWVPPGLMVVIDECDQVFDAKDANGKAVADRWAKLAKRVRKLGVGFIVASQYSGQKVFGNSELLRLNLAARNYVAMATKSKTSGALISGLPIDPTTLPEGKPGYGIISSPGARVAPFRAFWAVRSDDPKVAMLNLTPPVWADELCAALPEPRLHPVDAVAIKDRFADTEAAAATARDKAVANLKSIMSGTRVHREPVASASSGPGIVCGAVPDVPAGLTREDLFAATVAQMERDLDALTDRQRAVLTSMLDGATRTGEIVTACGGDSPTVRRWVHSTLNELEAASWVVDGGHGRWLLTNDAREELAASAAGSR
jgi:hypothetical protein